MYSVLFFTSKNVSDVKNAINILVRHSPTCFDGFLTFLDHLRQPFLSNSFIKITAKINCDNIRRAKVYCSEAADYVVKPHDTLHPTFPTMQHSNSIQAASVKTFKYYFGNEKHFNDQYLYLVLGDKSTLMLFFFFRK